MEKIIDKAVSLLNKNKLESVIELLDKELNGFNLSFKQQGKFKTIKNEFRSIDSNSASRDEWVSITFRLMMFLHDMDINFSKRLTTKAIDGVIRIDPDEAIEMAMDIIPNASYMKVIGAGRQHYLDQAESELVRSYYKVVEDRLSDDANNVRPFYIRRVTQHELKDGFYEHLKSCFEIIDKNHNKYEIVHYGKLKITNTFYIINDKDGKNHLYITLNIDDGIQLFDNVLAFYTTNTEIVTNYELHFDQFWIDEGESGRVITDLNSFKRYIPFDDDMYKKYTAIKNFIKSIPNDSYRTRHLKAEIDRIYERLMGLKSCQVTYKSTIRNEEISFWFSYYMKELGIIKGIYRSVSVYQFWRTIENFEQFMNLQEISLLKGATIERIYFIDSNLILQDYNDIVLTKDQYSEFVDFQKKIIYENYLLLRERQKNYTFKIIFSTKSKEATPNQNFAIWGHKDDNKEHPIDYKILFDMNYHVGGATEISFANYEDESTIHHNRPTVQGKELEFDQMLERAKIENERLLNYYNNREKFTDKGTFNHFEQQIQYLEKCGIDDIPFLLNN